MRLNLAKIGVCGDKLALCVKWVQYDSKRGPTVA